MDMTMAIDKLEKVGREKVKEEMVQRGIPSDSVNKLDAFMDLEGDNRQKTHMLREMLSDDEGLQGVAETEEILEYMNVLSLNNVLEFDPRLARGLDYYTGTIFEVKANDVEIGSICGGGRYDDLTGIFGLQDVSGVGISFGAERIFDVMEKLDLFFACMMPAARIMFVNFGQKEAAKALEVLQQLRKANIEAEIYPDAAKMKKQFTYANNKGIAYVGMIGEDEINKGMVTVKNMETGEQKAVSLEELKGILSEEA